MKNEPVDMLNPLLFEKGLLAMDNSSGQVDRVLSLTSISKCLEGIGDRRVTLGQLLVFVVQGKDLPVSRWTRLPRPRLG